MTYTFILQQFIFSPRLTLTFILHTKTKERGRSERKAWTRWKRANLIIVTYYWTDCPFHWLTHCWISRLLISSRDPPWPCHLSLLISSPLPLDKTTDPLVISLSLSSWPSLMNVLFSMHFQEQNQTPKTWKYFTLGKRFRQAKHNLSKCSHFML